MTPGARVSAAIAVLDQIGRGTPAEKALTGWARASRFAGSKDRAAVRDHVFDVLRARRSLGDGDGRSLMLRLGLREGWVLDDLFVGIGHAPAAMTASERAALSVPLALEEAASCDIPDWLWPHWHESLRDDAVAVAQAQQGRAEIFLRVNRGKADADTAIASLAEDGITTERHANVAGCLRVTDNPRKVKAARAYLEGLVELQDAASQSAIAAVPLSRDARILDYCAGGGGKSLGFADRGHVTVFAHDIDPRRMRDLPVRATRAGVQITTLTTKALAQHGPFDVVFCDAPCSGAGTWRRAPDAKWRLTAERLADLTQSQDAVLEGAAPLVAADGVLVYATCSVLESENDAAIGRFIAENDDWRVSLSKQILPDGQGDGFYYAILMREKNNL